MSYCPQISFHSIQGYARDLFERPLSKELPIAQKVANIFFHALTLLIPLGIYMLARHCGAASSSTEDIDPFIELSQDTQEQTIAQQTAIEFALNQISYYPPCKGVSIEEISAKPPAERLSLLIPIFFGFVTRTNTAFGLFFPTFQDPEDTHVNEDGHCLMQLAYAISTWALELEDSDETQVGEGVTLSEARKLCSEMYRQLLSLNPGNTFRIRLELPETLRSNSTHTAPESWTALFDDLNTPQHEWSILATSSRAALVEFTRQQMIKNGENP